MKKEKIKYYDSNISKEAVDIFNMFIIFVVFTVAYLVGYMLGTSMQEEKIKKLEEENYNQFVEIDSLRETIDVYERTKYKRGVENE